MIYVARQLGHSAQLTMRTHGHVIEELDDAPRLSAEDAIAAARRDNDVRQECVEINGRCDAHGSRLRESAAQTRVSRDGRYWARTSDLLLVRQALYQLS